MTVQSLIKLVKSICDSGFGNWYPCFSVSYDENYSINHIFIDEDDVICLQYTEYEYNTYYLQAWKILKILKKYRPHTYVYFQKVDCEGNANNWDIKDKWYHSTYDDGSEDIFIECDERSNNADDSNVVERIMSKYGRTAFEISVINSLFGALSGLPIAYYAINNDRNVYVAGLGKTWDIELEEGCRSGRFKITQIDGNKGVLYYPIYLFPIQIGNYLMDQLKSNPSSTPTRRSSDSGGWLWRTFLIVILIGIIIGLLLFLWTCVCS